ncbi:hypothetical protein [Gordonia sp. (in: high G+C Gram-positive bacteria)]|uniref:poly(ethylene terephthalate) hydrolase family protein n=1 Tax=Gordonia sp. (in: high G+C Gram-positive bacteria) TaxID=84139 RepID=UPI003C766A32
MALTGPSLSGIAQAQPQSSPRAQPETIQAKYGKAGPWEVSTREGAGCCDAAGQKFDVWYPKDLAGNGTPRPVITWGDGANAVPQQYDYLLTHLASWGFVVVAAHNRNTGSGQELLDGARFARTQNAKPSSIFYKRLDTDNVGAMGHSLGAVGAINAAAKSNGLIKSAIPIEPPGQIGCGPKQAGALCSEPDKITDVSMLYINGTKSSMPPANQAKPVREIGIASLRAYFDMTPHSVNKAMATAVGLKHNDIQGQPSCTPDNFECVVGVKPYLGLLTAWNMGVLAGNARALSAFTSNTGEFYSYKDWANQASNITN